MGEEAGPFLPHGGKLGRLCMSLAPCGPAAAFTLILFLWAFTSWAERGGGEYHADHQRMAGGVVALPGLVGVPLLLLLLWRRTGLQLL